MSDGVRRGCRKDFQNKRYTNKSLWSLSGSVSATVYSMSKKMKPINTVKSGFPLRLLSYTISVWRFIRPSSNVMSVERFGIFPKTLKIGKQRT